MSERYINNLTGDFSICFSEHLTEHPKNLVANGVYSISVRLPIRTGYNSKEVYSFFVGEQLITVVTVVTPNIAK